MAGVLNTGVPINVYKGYLPTSSTSLYTVATGKLLILTEALIVNKNAGALTPTLKCHTSDTAGYEIHKSEMGIGETRNLALGTVIVAGESIYGDDGAGAGSDITCRMSGMLFDAP